MYSWCKLWRARILPATVSCTWRRPSSANWLEEIKLNWPRIKQPTSHDKRLEEILQKHAPPFGKDLGTLQGIKAKLHVDSTATRISMKPDQCHRLSGGKLNKTSVKTWESREHLARPILLVGHTHCSSYMKNDRTVRVCGDYKLTVNKVSKLDGYPIPELDDLYTKWAEGKRLPG